MFRTLLLAGAMALGLALALTLAVPAFAAEGAVTIPWGDWLADAATAAGATILALAAWMLRFVPAAVHDWYLRLTGERVEQLLERAVHYGINATAGAVRGRTLDVRIGSEVARRALEYAVKHAPELVKRLGGTALVNEKILARLDLAAEANIGRVS